jgi:sugar lactone lactonase YvrE
MFSPPAPSARGLFFWGARHAPHGPTMGAMTWTPLEDSACQLGESPFWHPHEHRLYWLDIPGRAVLRATLHESAGDAAPPRARAVERWALPSEPGCMAPARSGGLVIALRDGIHRARDWGGALELLEPAVHDTRTMRYNDGKCDALGRFWAGTLNEAKDGATAELHCLDLRPGRPAGAPRFAVMARAVTTANGLAFSPDRRTVYWADTAAHHVRAWDWDAASNTLVRERTFARFDAKPGDWTPASPVAYEGRPDGATVDSRGDYWVAMFEGARLLHLSATGERIETVTLPAQCPTMPCFGGDDLRTLFVTTAAKGRPAEELARWPDSGRVLARRVATPGLPVEFFED